MTETLTTPQEHFGLASRNGQEAMSMATRAWSEAMQSLLRMAGGQVSPPDPELVIGRWFDVAEIILQAQHEFMEGMVNLGRPTMEAMAHAAHETSEAVRHGQSAEDTDRPSAKSATAARSGRAN
jgi:hypothetical protein